MKIQNHTLEYYDTNARIFIDRTKTVDMSDLYEQFLSGVPESGRILDLGCGSGRDSLHFLELGYEVIAVDGSKAICAEAEQLIGQEVKCIDIMNLSSDGEFQEKFHGIWACASLLHISREQLERVLPNLLEMLLPDGVMF